ncbi:MAG: hypothetical protein QOH31_2894 [Verrucomicrobiota bacterium]|jgi:hypothetical protein
MSARKISYRWHRSDQIFGASQAGLTPRLTPAGIARSGGSSNREKQSEYNAVSCETGQDAKLRRRVQESFGR